jgi:hypothetical protein
MFGSGRRIDELEQRILEVREALEAGVLESEKRTERRLEALENRLGTNPDERLDFLLNSVAEELRRKLRAALEEADRANALAARITELHAQLEAGRWPALTAARSRPVLNRVYRAEWTGYVSLYFDGGLTDSVRLLVGEEDPPRECVCELNSRNDINSYAATVVRKGEYWLAQSSHDAGSSKSGVKCVFTPFM